MPDQVLSFAHDRIAGYRTQRGDVMCPDCWREQAARGARPAELLLAESPADPDDAFWVVEACAGCGAPVKHGSTTLLD